MKNAKRMKKPSHGRADFARLDRMTDAEIRRSSPRELADLPPGFFEDAAIVTPPTKRAVSLRLDPDIVAWFRRRGPGYQTRINAALRAFVALADRPRAK